MKRIYLVRHAKADSYDQSVADVDRPLVASGREDARAMAEYLLSNNILAERIISSPALRAFSTAQIFALAGLFKEGDIVLEPALYDSTAQDYFRILCEQDDSISSLFIFGHNPSISELMSSLSKGRELELSTCNVALLEFSVDSWETIEHRSGRNLGILSPSIIKAL
ncbi:MAG: hypothetical protein EYC69_00240 [Bacteroidetes bacterium]|nr:MAG: hypothetical protein EYC69_00240 [Bacteroidota bacterium]